MAVAARRISQCLAAAGLLAVLALLAGRSHDLALLRNTGLLVLGSCAIALPLGSQLALAVVRTDLPGRHLAGGLLVLALFVPLYVQAAGWQAGFGTLGWFSVAADGWVLGAGWRAAVWIHAMAAIPWVALIVAAGLWFVEPELEEDALLDASAMQVFRRVTLRRGGAALGVAALWVAVNTAGEMTVTDLFQIRTYAEVLYTQIRLGALPAEVTVGMLPGMALFAVLLWAAFVSSSRLAPTAHWTSTRAPVRFRLRRWRWPAAIGVWSLLLFLFGLPLVNLAVKTGVVVTANQHGFERSWSLWKCLRMVAGSPLRNWEEFRWSLVIGAFSAAAAVVVALPLTWLARRGKGRSLLTLLVVAVCLALPGPVIGFGLIWLLNRPEIPWLVELYDHSILAPWLALLVRSLPLAALVLWHGLRSVSPETLEAAASEGAGRLTRFWRIALPQRLSALGVAWLVAFAVCLGDLAATILVVPPGVMLLSNLIFDRLHGAQEDDVSSICLALIIVFALIAIAVARLTRRWRLPA